MKTILRRCRNLLLCCLLLIGLLPLGQTAHAAEITNLSATITLPTAGAHPVRTGTPGNSALYSVRSVSFYDGHDQVYPSDTFETGKTYEVTVYFTPVSGNTITADTATINGSYTAAFEGYGTAFGDGTQYFTFLYTVPAAGAPAPDPENPGTRIRKVTVSGIQVPVIWETLDGAFTVSPDAAYKKETGSQSIRWTKKDGSYEISCAEGERVASGETYYATIILRSKDKPFDGDHAITITANTLHGTDAVYHKVVNTRYTLSHDNMVMELKLTFRACMVYDYTFTFTNAPGKPHGMPKAGDCVWDYSDVVPITQESDINSASLFWYKSGTSTYLYPQDTFQAGQEYELYFYLTDGETAIIEPDTIIVYYDDSTGLYFEGELVADTHNGECHAWMEPKFTPVDPILHEVELVHFSAPVIGDTVGEHLTVWANTNLYGAEYELVSQTWHNQAGNTLPDSYEFEPAVSYYSQFILRPLNDFSFDSGTDVTLKDYAGNTIPLSSVQLQSNGTLRVRTELFSLIGTVDTVRIYSYVPPTVGRLAGWCYPSIGSSAPYEFNQLTWRNVTDNVVMSDSDAFEAGKTYYLMFTVKAKPGYILSADAEVAMTHKISGSYVELYAPAYSNGMLICSTRSEAAMRRITGPVRVYGYSGPVAGDISLNAAEMLSVPENCGYRISFAGWVNTNYQLLSDYAPLQAGEQYGLVVSLVPQEGCYFDVPVSLGSLALYDAYGNNITGSTVQWDGAGNHAFGYIPGTNYLFFYTKWETAAELIDYVEFSLDEPVDGAAPDYTPTYPSGAPYYSADESHNGYYLNNIKWDSLHVGENFGSGTHWFNMYISPADGYLFPTDPDDIAIMFNGYELGRYTSSVSVLPILGGQKLNVSVTFDSNFRYKVSFANLGYGLTPPTQYVVSGNTAVRPEDPAAYGMRFLGWYTDAACTNAYSFSAPVTSDIILYAKWETAATVLVGDVNGDGSVTGVDAVLLNRCLAGWSVSIDTDAADVNRDGSVTGVDAVLLQRYLAGWAGYDGYIITVPANP